MATTHERDLENVGATILETRDDDRIGDYSIEFDGSFEDLLANTDHRYKCEARTYENERGRRYAISIRD